MAEIFDLKAIEKKAFRSTHQDGLWDIYIGGIILSMSFLVYSDGLESQPLLRIGLYLAGMLGFYALFWGGKKYITVPRLGQVKFSRQRQMRTVTMKIILGVIVAIQGLILAGTILLWKNPEWAARLGFANLAPDLERLMVSAIGAAFVGPSICLIAYFNEFPRGYYIAVILSLAVFSMVWFDQPAYLIGASLLVILPGIYLFVRFLQANPVPGTGDPHE